MLTRWFRWLWRKAAVAQASSDVLVYSRHGCHLCEDALSLLREHERAYSLVVREVNIDGDPELVAKFGDSVPVVEIDGKVRFRGRVSETLLRRLLRAREFKRPE